MLRLNLYGSLAVLATVSLIGVAFPAIDRALPAGKSMSAGERIPVGLTVSVAAPPHTVLDVTKTSPSLNRVVMAVHSVRIVVEATRYEGTLAGLSARLRRKIQSNPGYQASQREHRTSTRTHVPGLQGSYSTPGRVGMYAVFEHDDVGVEISLAGTETDLRRGNDALVTMVRSIRFEAT
ncbi:MAG: hypothetical protein WCA46_20615 [Actinocatenispora sp.]